MPVAIDLPQTVIKADRTLITGRPSAWVRHPIYTGILLGLLGTAVTPGTVVNFVEVPLVAFAVWLQLRREEENFMFETFGQQYTTYRQGVKVLIPHVI